MPAIPAYNGLSKKKSVRRKRRRRRRRLLSDSVRRKYNG
jgi:hypothetical protein